MAVLLVGAFSFLYWFTLAPTVLWGDSAKLAIYVKEMFITVDPIGNHMLHTVLGKVFDLLPVGDFAFRQNLMSACFGAAALALFYRLMDLLLRNKPIAFYSSFCLGLSHTFWLVSVINESYAIFLFFFILGLWFLVKWEQTGSNAYLYLHSAFIGVGLLNNMLEGVMIPATLLFLFLSERGRRWLFSPRFLLGFLCFILVLSPFILLTIKTGPVPVRAYQWFLRPGEIFPEILFYPGYLFYQFPFVGFCLGWLGAKQMSRLKKQLFWVLGLMMLLDVFFASGYLRQRRFFLLLPSYVCFAVWIGYGLQRIIHASTFQKAALRLAVSALLVLTPVTLYFALPLVANHYRLELIRGRRLAYRNNNTFYLNPIKRWEFGAREYGLESLRVAKPNSCIVGDFTPSMVLSYYQKIEGLRPDVLISIAADRYVMFPERRREFYDFISNLLKERPVYIADNEESYYTFEELKRRFEVIPQGPIWEIRHHGS